MKQCTETAKVEGINFSNTLTQNFIKNM